ncbi:MAG: bifunctional UDP-sugar hydrolase/5'-nucleotidase [Pseudomonadota bacterium]
MQAFLRLLSALIIVAPVLTSADQRVTIAFTNDFESAYDPVAAYWRDDIDNIGGIAELATLVELIRSESDVFFLFDAGDIFTGTLARLTRGAVSFDLMALIGYDAMVIGNHEFEYGWQEFEAQQHRVPFPVLGSNLFYAGTTHAFAKPYTIIERGGIRVGVVGILGQDAATALIPSNIAGLDVAKPTAVVRRWVQRLRDDCDLVIVLTHQGMTAPMQTDDEADAAVQRGNAANLELAGAVTGIDAILAGHTDAGTRTPLIHPATGTVVMQTFGQGQHLGVLEFVKGDDGGVSFESGRLVVVNADELEPSLPVAERLAEYRAQHADVYTVVGQLDAPLTRRYYAESSQGNAFADIVRHAAGADVGLMPSGALRKDIAAGDVRRVDLLDAFPFEDRVARVVLPGSVLRDVLEQGLSLERGFLQLSGISIRYDLNQPIGQRLVEALVGGAPLMDAQLYTVGTVEILAKGGDRYTQFAAASDSELLELGFGDALLAAFAGTRVSAPPIGRATAIER